MMMPFDLIAYLLHAARTLGAWLVAGLSWAAFGV